MKKIISSVVLVNILILLAGQGWGADYYASPAGSNISPYDTWEKAATNPASAITLGNSTTGPHTLYIAPGAYNAYLALTDADWDNSTILGTSAHGSISPASKGQVIINTTAGQHGLRNQRASVTIKNISITGADSTHDILYYDGSGMIAENLYLYNGGRRLFNAQGGTAFTLRKSLLKGAGGAASLYASGAGSGTIESSIITNSPTLSSGASYSLQNAGSGAIVVNNSVISGGSYQGVGNTGTGTTTINNSIVSPGENMAGYAIYNPSGAVHVSNSVLMKGWGSYPTYSYAPLSTDTNNIKGFSPAFRRWQRSGFIVPCVDDNGGLSYALELESQLSSRGLRGSWFVYSWNISNILSSVQAMLDRGVISIGCHTYSHSRLSLTGNIYSITKDSHTINVDRANDQIVVSGSSPVTVAGFRSKTLSSIITELTAGGCSVGSLPDGLEPVALGEIMADSSGAQASPYTPQILIDTTGATGFFKAEIFDSKVQLESSLTGHICRSIASPGGMTSTDVETACQNAGYWGMRNGYSQSDAEHLLSSIDLFQQAYIPSAQFIKGRRITSATQANPVVITSSKHGFVNGETITIDNATGMTELNGNTYTVANVTTDTYELSGIDGTGYSAYSSGGVAYNDSTIVKNTKALCDNMAQYGGIIYIVSHSENELSADQWGLVLDTIQDNYPEITITDMDTAMNTIRNGGIWSTSDNRIYSRTWSDASDLRLRANSPCINAGIDIGLTSDFEGNAVPKGSAPDIGAYEYYPRKKFVQDLLMMGGK